MTNIKVPIKLINNYYPSNNTTRNNLPHFPYFNQIANNKSYIPMSGFVLSHILLHPDLSHLEKLFYISADSLSLINANTGKQRSVALPSYKWAAQLGCSRSQVFKLQQSLSEKGYFIIIKDKNKSGQNKRNLIIPTLPCKAFDILAKTPNRAGDHLPYNPLQESTRAYLDRTKLFVRLNYHLLKTVTSNEHLTSFHKVLWLDLFVQSYKCNSVKNRIDKDTRIDSDSKFSLKVSYPELVDRYSCDKRYLSKAMSILEEIGFISRRRFHIQGEDLAQDRKDKSLWQITLSIPSEHEDVLLKLNDRSNLKLSPETVDTIISGRNVQSLKVNDTKQGYNEDLSQIQHQYALSHCSLSDHSLAPLEVTLDIRRNETIESKTLVASYDPDVAEFRPLLNKTFKTNKNIKNKDNLDSGSVFFKKSVSFKNYFKESEKTENFNESGNKELSKKLKPVIKPVNIANLTNKEVMGAMEQLTYLRNSANKEKITDLKAEQLKIEQKQNIITIVPASSSSSFYTNKRLKDLYPLDETLVRELNHKSGREFSVNFVNELLLKLDSKYPLMSFGNNKQILAYLTKAFQYEKHQSSMVNHESFRFARIEPIEQKKEKMEKYLVAIEEDYNTSAASQLKRKIVALFETEVAYSLLTESKFTRPFPQVFYVDLAHNLILTETQQERLTNEIQLIYGKDIGVMYNEMKYIIPGNNTAKIERQQDEIYLEELDPATAWYQVRSALKNQFGNGLDKAWFSKLRAEEDTTQRKITLKAPTRFFKDWITQKYGAAIENSCKIINYQLDALVT